jgi:hypothetical protein
MTEKIPYRFEVVQKPGLRGGNPWVVTGALGEDGEREKFTVEFPYHATMWLQCTRAVWSSPVDSKVSRAVLTSIVQLLTAKWRLEVERVEAEFRARLFDGGNGYGEVR